MPTWVVNRLEFWVHPVVIEANNESDAIYKVQREGLGSYGVYAPYYLEPDSEELDPERDVYSQETIEHNRLRGCLPRTSFDDLRDQVRTASLTFEQIQLLVADLTLGKALDLKGVA